MLLCVCGCYCVFVHRCLSLLVCVCTCTSLLPIHSPREIRTASEAHPRMRTRVEWGVFVQEVTWKHVVSTSGFPLITSHVAIVLTSSPTPSVVFSSLLLSGSRTPELKISFQIISVCLVVSRILHFSHRKQLKIWTVGAVKWVSHFVHFFLNQHKTNYCIFYSFQIHNQLRFCFDNF